MKESVFLIQCSRFFAPSNLSGIGGMHHEHIHACPAWRKEHPHYDCIFVNTNLDLEGMRGWMCLSTDIFFFHLQG
ncbi:hypothetical protein BD769DRAFT_1350853 [Suillus cothurnatus]|nr:hypothetical protein BD769DRAFT_1350853 [Suillus cothurnatus]